MKIKIYIIFIYIYICICICICIYGVKYGFRFIVIFTVRKDGTLTVVIDLTGRQDNIVSKTGLLWFKPQNY